MASEFDFEKFLTDNDFLPVSFGGIHEISNEYVLDRLYVKLTYNNGPKCISQIYVDNPDSVLAKNLELPRNEDQAKRLLQEYGVRFK